MLLAPARAELHRLAYLALCAGCEVPGSYFPPIKSHAPHLPHPLRHPSAPGHHHTALDHFLLVFGVPTANMPALKTPATTPDPQPQPPIRRRAPRGAGRQRAAAVPQRQPQRPQRQPVSVRAAPEAGVKHPTGGERGRVGEGEGVIGQHLSGSLFQFGQRLRPGSNTLQVGSGGGWGKGSVCSGST